VRPIDESTIEEIFEYAAEGKSQQEIEKLLNISQQTVSRYLITRYSVLSKENVRMVERFYELNREQISVVERFKVSRVVYLKTQKGQKASPKASGEVDVLSLLRHENRWMSGMEIGKAFKKTWSGRLTQQVNSLIENGQILRSENGKEYQYKIALDEVGMSNRSVSDSSISRSEDENTRQPKQSSKTSRKFSNIKEIKIPLGEQVFYAKHGAFPIDFIKTQGNTVIRREPTEIVKISLDSGDVLYTDEVKKEYKQGSLLDGIAIEIGIGTRGSGVKIDEVIIGKELNVIDPRKEKSEELRKEIDNGTFSIDYDKATEEISPDYEGDKDIKEILLYAFCSLEEDNAFDTSVPVILYGLSGKGKSVFLDGLKKSIKAFVLRASRVRTTLAGMMTPEGRILYPQLPKTIVIDELDKAESKYLFDLLPFFGREEREAVSYARKYQERTDFWMVGTMLKDLGKLKDQRRKDVLLQLSRRCVALHLTSNSPKELTRRVMTEEIGMAKKKQFNETELSKLAFFVETTRQKGDITYEDWDWTENYLTRESEMFSLGEDTYWAGDLRRLILRLSKGRALGFGRTIIENADLKYITTILKKHAVSLNYHLSNDKEQSEEENAGENLDGWKTSNGNLKEAQNENAGGGNCDNCGTWSDTRVLYDNKALCQSCYQVRMMREEGL